MARFFTADLHLWDEDIAKARGFKDITEYHNRLREGWLQVLKPEDTVYVLGDISKGDWLSRSFALDIPGHKILVPGNHDDFKAVSWLAEHKGWEIQFAPAVVLDGMKFICTHYPVHGDELLWYAGNLHGHIHRPYPEMGYEPQQWPSPSSPWMPGDKAYFNVNVEFNSYGPVSEDTIVKYFKSRG